jgi:Sigma-70 region 2
MPAPAVLFVVSSIRLKLPSSGCAGTRRRIAAPEYGRLVYAVAQRPLDRHDLAEEAAQQTFVRAWQAADRIDVDRDSLRLSRGGSCARRARTTRRVVPRRQAMAAHAPLRAAIAACQVSTHALTNCASLTSPGGTPYTASSWR